TGDTIIDAEPLALRAAVDDCQRQLIRRALAASKGNWTQAARRLEVDPSNLHKLARRLELRG
ncbi:MAG TPA: helix-turn-helix domain-containing protein, partial [Burkholderiaceae bacterium]|nr:helix-turn-helix domain-containing protein [Burkholderiaceae bacterium]